MRTCLFILFLWLFAVQSQAQQADYSSIAENVGSKVSTLFPVNPNAESKVGPNVLQFTSDAVVTAEVHELLANQLAGSLATGVTKSDLLKMLNGGELQKAMAQIFRKYRFSTSDLADILTAHLVMCWQVANDVSDLDEGEGYQKMREQLRAALLQSSWPHALDNAQKQKLGEMIGTGTMLIVARYQNGKQNRNANMVKMAAKDASDMARNFTGVELTDFTIDHRGLIFRNDVTPSPISQTLTAESVIPADPQPVRSVTSGVTSVEHISLLVDYETGYGGAVYPVYNPYVFFSDGTVVKEPKIAVQDLDLSSRNKEEGRWGKWEMNGEKVQITWDARNRRGEIQRTEKDWPGYTAHAAGKDEKLDGTWSSAGGGGNVASGGGTGIFVSNRYRFHPDGRFTSGSLAALSSHTEIAGTSTGVSAHAKKDEAGSYHLDGHTLTLTFDDGSTRRLFFCFLGNDKRVLRIGGSNFTPTKQGN